MSKQCSYIKTDGSQCRGFAISHSNYCFFRVANSVRYLANILIKTIE